MSTEETTQVTIHPPDKTKIRRIWRVALYLGLITAAEFVIAFTMTPGPGKTFIFISLTLVKAFYIVSEFMHLKYEVKVLIWSIVLPIIFVIWLIIALIYEGGAIFDAAY